MASFPTPPSPHSRSSQSGLISSSAGRSSRNTECEAFSSEVGTGSREENTSMGGWRGAGMAASLWLRRFGIAIVAAALWAAATAYAGGSQKAPPKKSLQQKSFQQMRYHGGPKSPMWRG